MTQKNCSVSVNFATRCHLIVYKTIKSIVCLHRQCYRMRLLVLSWANLELHWCTNLLIWCVIKMRESETSSTG